MLKQFDFELLEEIDVITTEQIYNYKNSNYENTSYKWNMPLRGKPQKSRTKKMADLGEEEWKKTVEFIKTKMPKILYFPTALFDLPDKIYLDPINDQDYKSKFYSLVVQDILDSLNEQLNIKEHLVDRINSANPTDKDHVKQVCLRIGRVLSSEILKTWSTVLTNKAKGIAVDVDKDDKGIFIEFKIEGED